jgi:hypothetical protein
MSEVPPKLLALFNHAVNEVSIGGASIPAASEAKFNEINGL